MIVTYIFLRQIPKWMLSLSRCLKHSPLLPSPSSLTVSSSQSSSLLHHLQMRISSWGDILQINGVQLLKTICKVSSSSWVDISWIWSWLFFHFQHQKASLAFLNLAKKAYYFFYPPSYVLEDYLPVSHGSDSDRSSRKVHYGQKKSFPTLGLSG